MALPSRASGFETEGRTCCGLHSGVETYIHIYIHMYMCDCSYVHRLGSVFVLPGRISRVCASARSPCSPAASHSISYCT